MLFSDSKISSLFLILTTSLQATTWTVDVDYGYYYQDTSQSNTGSLSYCMANAAANDTINVNSGLTITLDSSTPLPPIIYSSITINGNGSIIDGNSEWPIFSVVSGATNVNINDFTLQNALSLGGSGGQGAGAATGGAGGGGAAGGAAFYVDTGTVLNITTVSMNNCAAQGGAGSISANAGGGGGGGGGGFSGGFGGNAGGYPGIITGGGGGGGSPGGADGGSIVAPSNALSYTYAGGGGGGVAYPSLTYSDGSSSGNGNSGGTGIGYLNEDTSYLGGGGGGGAGGTGEDGGQGSGFDGGAGGDSWAASSGSGFGGGGGGVGGVNISSSGSGTIGFGAGGAGSGTGGGGGSYGAAGGAGGSSGGGGGGGSTGGAGGFGAGGGSPNGSGGAGLGGDADSLISGGGAAMGGAIFIVDGGILNLYSDISFSGNSVVGGAGPTTASALGTDIFLSSGGYLNVFAGSGSTLTLENAIASDQGGGGGSGGGLTVYTGTLALNGTNTYTGTTTIESGATLIVNGSILGTVDSDVLGDAEILSGGTLVLNSSTACAYTSDIINDGTLYFNPTSSVTYAGQITGSGAVVQNGTGTLTLTGDNTYSGGTLIEGAGGIAISSDTQIGQDYVQLENNSFLSTSGTFSLSNQINIDSGGGIILVESGSLSLINIGGDEDLTIQGASSSNDIIFTGSTGGEGGNFTGSMEVTNITMTIDSDYTFGVEGETAVTTTSSGELNVYGTLNGTTIDNSSGSSDFTVNIPTGGTITLDSTFTNESSGTVSVSGTITCSAFNNYGTLSGCGTINATSVSNYAGSGIYSGCSISPLVINADLISRSGSLVSPTMDTQDISSYLITGNMLLEDNVTLLLRPEAGCYDAIHNYNLATVSDTITGTFTTVEAGSVFLVPTLTYESHEIILTIERNPFADIVHGANAKAVATTLDTLIEQGDAGGANLTCMVIKELFYSSPAEISAVLNEMQPSLYKGLTLSQENNAVRVRDALSYRMEDVQNLVYCMPVGSKGAKDKAINVCQKDTRTIHIWGDGFGDILSQKSIHYAGSPQFGYQTNTGGAVMGIDGRFCNYFYAGALGAYTSSGTKWDDNAGKGHIETGYAGLYFSAISDRFYSNLAVIGGWSHFKAHRNIHFPTETFTAKNSHGGSQLLSHIDTGINLGWSGFTIRPFDSFDYVVQREGSYTETGAGNFDLTVEKSNAILIRNELGLQVAACFCTGGNKWTIAPKISWVREVRVKGATYTAETVYGVPFEVTGYFPDRSLVSPGVLVSGNLMNDLLSVDLYFDGEYANKYSDNNFGAQIRYGF